MTRFVHCLSSVATDNGQWTTDRSARNRDRPLAVCLLRRKVQCEHAALPERAFDADPPAVSLGDLADHAQPKAAAADLRSDHILAAIERLEDMRQVGWGDATPTILYGDIDL